MAINLPMKYKFIENEAYGSSRSRTEQRYFIVGDDVDALLIKNTLNYTTWLSREHDARKELVNLWSYLNRILVSDMFELYAHYQVVSQGGSRPMGIVDFSALAKTFQNACWYWDSVKDKWPYTCFDTNFFCYMQYGLDSQKQTVVESYWEYQDGSYVMVEKIVPISTVNKMSRLGIDRNQRSYVIQYYFNNDVLEFIPESDQNNVFYHSRLMWESLSQLMNGKESFDKWIRDWIYVGFEAVEDHVKRKCNEHSGKPVGDKYFCLAKDYTVKIRNCGDLADVTPCVYDKEIQDYFVRGRFGEYDELNLINSVLGKTQAVLTEFKDKVVANDRNGLNSLYDKYNPYITVDDSMCVLEWPNAFDCTNNMGCNSILDNWKFDCNGGYTCRINMMYRFDCMVKFVLKQTKQLVDAAASGNWGLSSVKKAKYDLMIWLSYLPMARYTSLGYNDINDVIMSTQSTVNDYVTSYDTKGLKTFATNLPPMTFVPQWAKNAACQQVTVPTEYTIFCNLDPLLNSVFLFINAFENGEQSTTKNLNPTVDYPALLGQLQLDRISNYINLMTEALFNDISSQLEENFGELSNYFSSLADYDKTKAEADIAYIDGRLTVFKEKITSLSVEVEKMFQTVFYFSVGINVAELVSRTAEVGVAVAQVAHPGNQILGGSSVLDLMGAINELAQAGVTTAIIAQLHDEAFPELIEKAQNLGNGFAENEEQLFEAKDLIDKLKEGTDAVGTANDFLGKYNAYDPKVLLSDITSYGTQWEVVSDQLCEAAFSSGTAAAALGEIGLASTGDCVKIGVLIAELVTLYEEFYDYQFDLMDSLSDTARAYLAYQKANDLKLIYTSGARVDKAFLQHTAVNTFMVSTLNIWEVVTEYCDILTYTRGGEVPDKCVTAMDTPSHNAVAQVISYMPADLCHINNEITDYREIPTKPKDSNDKAYINLDALYAQEAVKFKIPSFQWLKDNGWVGPQDREKAMYIKRFELFLIPMSGSQQHTVELQVEPSVANYLRYGGTKYLLPVTGYTARYTENSFNCYHEQINNPYALCNDDDLVKLCITSNGYIDRKVQPSIYNEWKVSATSLPTGQVAPKPTTNFKLQAGVTMCVVNLAPSATKREIPTIRSILKSKAAEKPRRASQHCCGSNQYWTGTTCTACPSGSTKRLHGYYCQ
ncbi:hypothetical protein LOTGIDRAFT_236232 [Lottia gigantea]|uniref:Uncharacterized protein n=1 Tax=Lottia gigantea TaxID=225164 RepID=V3ZK07_LOTGI|nr:hypothetical protein LOTGIDRAFT_236232 [Lottia gigantea]ESO84582.1 hypothetical protein LOTGIDRAFT_236232 [Lottia gigantea]